MLFVAILLLIVAIGILKFVKDIADDIRAMRNDDMPRLLSRMLRQTGYQGFGTMFVASHSGSGHRLLHTRAGSAVIWVWRDGRWNIAEAPEGVDPGLEPDYPGAYDGDMAKSWISEQR